MTRKETVMACMAMCEKYAREYNLGIVSRRKADSGLWDVKEFTRWSFTMTEHLEKEFGSLEETFFTDVPIEVYDLRKDFQVSFEYRFSHPKVCIGTQWGEGGYAAIEFAPKDRENDTDYEVAELLCFKETGVKFARKLLDDWHEMCRKGENYEQ